MLDYYLLGIDGVLVEEFVHDQDHTTIGLRGAVWESGDPQWLSAARLGRAVRANPSLLAQVTPTDRAGAEAAYGRLSGDPLPAEPALREAFLETEPFPTAPPLRLTPPEAPAGFRERRVYRVLFAKEPANPMEGRRTTGDDVFHWTLRRVGNGLAWALDVTVLLATDADDNVGPTLRDLTTTARRHGLVPVTTERFA